MLFSTSESEEILLKIDKLMEQYEPSELSEYIKTIATQLKAALKIHLTWVIPNIPEKNIYDTYKEKIQAAFQQTTFDTMREAHLSYAQFFKSYSLFDSIPGIGSDIVDFYLHPKFEEVTSIAANKVIYDAPVEIAGLVIAARLNKLEILDGKISTWEKNLEDWNGRVKDCEQRYEDVTKGNNYLGLAFAFKSLIEKKNSEAGPIKATMISLGSAAFLLPILHLFSGIFPIPQEAFNFSGFSTLAFSAAAEIIIIYYFRITYHRWSDIKKQITQLELRHSICAFTHEYAQKSKDLDKTTLAKFENLVFTEISQDNSPPPNIYDAADSIAKLLTAWKSNNKS